MPTGQSEGEHIVLIHSAVFVLVFASSLLLPLICSDRREAAGYLGSHDQEQDATSEWSKSMRRLYL